MFGFSNSLEQPPARPFRPLLVFGARNNADNNPYEAKPFDEPSAFALHSPEFMFGRGSGPKFGDTQGTKPGQSTTGAGSIPSPAFGTSSFPSFRCPNPPPAFGLITSSTASDGARTMSGSTSSHRSFGPWAASVAPAFAKTTASSSLGQSTPFPSVSQKGAQPGFGVPGIGTRVTPYKVTNVQDDAKQFGKMHSTSAMPAYANKSHEELRWEDHQSENKGTATGDFNPFRINNAGRIPFSLSSTSSWSKPTYNPFSSLSTTSAAVTVSPLPSTTTPPNPFSTATSPITFPSIATPTPSSPAVPSFSCPNTTSNHVTSTTTANLPPSSTTASFSPFTLSLPNTFPVPNVPFSFSSQATPSSFTAIPALQQTSFPSFPSPAPAQTNTQSSISSLLCPANPVGLNPSSFSLAPVQLSPLPQATSCFNVSNPGQLPLTMTGTTCLHNTQMTQLEPVTNPFGTLPPAPQLLFDRTGTRYPIQYGISTLPVVERPARARSSSLLITTSRDLSYRQLKLPVRKYNPRNDVPKVPFFGEDVEGIAVPRADAFFIRRENPRDLIVRPLPEIQMSHSDEKQSPMLNEASYAAGEAEDGPLEEEHDRSHPIVTFTQQAEIKVLMPKLCRSDYYTEPAIQELASKEKANPGFCSHVEGFVIGRHNYGNMRFLGDTDVRGLDLNILVQFNHREVIVYAEGSSKPKVGEGLNKPAEVTLLNIKCMDKKTGQRYTEGPRVKKYGEFLKKKAEDQGARFVSYDPVKGEWKFRVDHF